VDRDDVRVLEARGDAGGIEKQRAKICALDQLRAETPQGYGPGNSGNSVLLGDVEAAKASLPSHAHDAIVSDGVVDARRLVNSVGRSLSHALS
jgi:hypothetical protein